MIQDIVDKPEGLPLLSIHVEPHAVPLGRCVGVLLEGVMDGGEGFSPLLEMSGSNLRTQDAHFASSSGATWVLSSNDFPYELLVHMDPDTMLSVEGRIVFSVHPKVQELSAAQQKGVG